MRPRGWHLWEHHVLVDGHAVPGELPTGAAAICQLQLGPGPGHHSAPGMHLAGSARAQCRCPLPTFAPPSAAAGAIFDFAIYFFHNAKQLLGNGRGPAFYLPKMQVCWGWGKGARARAQGKQRG